MPSADQERAEREPVASSGGAGAAEPQTETVDGSDEITESDEIMIGND